VPLDEPRPSFARELYWFALISLGTWILGVYLLAPRLAKSRQSVEFERELEVSVSQLALKEREYEAAIAAMENDPFYRQAVYRSVLGVKQGEEVYIREPLAGVPPRVPPGASSGAGGEPGGPPDGQAVGQ
jgi:hypothetical protein